MAAISVSVVQTSRSFTLDQDEEYWRSMFLGSLSTIRALCVLTARRYRLRADETEELASAVRLRLLADDYDVLKKYQGRGTLKAYLAVVIRRTLLDRRIAEWGKWRSSAAARRYGAVGVLLERLIARDGMTFDQACLALQTNHGIAESRSALQKIYATLSFGTARRFVCESHGIDVPHPSASPFEQLAMVESQAVNQRAAIALRQAIASLSPDDQSLLQLKFGRGDSAAAIARSMNIDQKGLYRRFEKVLAGLRTQLESQGIRRQDLLVGC